MLEASACRWQVRIHSTLGRTFAVDCFKRKNHCFISCTWQNYKYSVGLYMRRSGQGIFKAVKPDTYFHKLKLENDHLIRYLTTRLDTSAVWWVWEAVLAQGSVVCTPVLDTSLRAWLSSTLLRSRLWLGDGGTSAPCCWCCCGGDGGH